MKKIAAFAIAFLLFLSVLSLTGENKVKKETKEYAPPDTPILCSDEPDMKDNAAHFKYFQNDSHVIRWYEWWYMNVKGEDGNNLLIKFFTFGDLNNPLASVVGIILVFMKEDGSTFESIKSYPCIEYSLDYEKCDVNIDGDVFIAVNKSFYKVTYHNRINDVSLSLNLSKITYGIKATPSHLQEWEWMKWYIPVPCGKVEGVLKYTKDGKRHISPIKGRGYHDHNWGIAKKFSLKWDWGEFSDETHPISIAYGWVGFGESSVTGGAYATNETTGESIYLPNLQFEYEEWIEVNGFKKPSRIHLYGITENFSIDVTIELQKFYIIGVGDVGTPYLFGRVTGNIICNGHSYDIHTTGFYEHHFFLE